MLYAPLVLAYEDGKYIGLHEYTAPEPTEAACLAVLKAEIAEIISTGTVPPDARVAGACLAIPAELQPDTSAPTVKAPKPYSPLTGKDGSQTL